MSFLQIFLIILVMLLILKFIKASAKVMVVSALLALAVWAAVYVLPNYI